MRASRNARGHGSASRVSQTSKVTAATGDDAASRTHRLYPRRNAVYPRRACCRTRMRAGARVTQRVVIASNRGPVSFYEGTDGRIEAVRASGGLATALRGLPSIRPMTWIASATRPEEIRVATEAAGASIPQWTVEGTEYDLRLIPHSPDEYARAYGVVSNPLLWFTHHYLWSLAETPVFDDSIVEAWESGYVP